MHRRRFYDIAVNLTDGVFRGLDRKGKRVHPDDFAAVMARAAQFGVERMLVSGTCLQTSRDAIELCRLYPGVLYCTVGIHPAHADEFLNAEVRAAGLAAVKRAAKKGGKAPAEPVQYTFDPSFAHSIVAVLRDLITANRDVVVAVGECGIDYAELNPMVTPALQAVTFDLQLELARELGMPLFLHSRDCGMDFVKLCRDFVARHAKPSPPASATAAPAAPSAANCLRGVVHSFNGSTEEVDAVIHELGLSVGLNFSAFRNEDEAKALMPRIPLDRLMLETDAPWCDPRPEQWGYKFVADYMRSSPPVPAATSSDGGEDRPSCATTTDVTPDDGLLRIPPMVPKETWADGMCVQRRSEPCFAPLVLEAVAGTLKEVGVTMLPPLDAAADVIFMNSMRMFHSEV